MSPPWIVAFLALWVMVVLLAVVVVGLLRRVGAVLESAESLLGARSVAEVALGGRPVGDEVPPFSMEQVAPDARSHEVSFAELLHEPTIVLFMGEHCGPCRELARDLANAEPAIAAAPLFVIIGEHDRTDGWLPEGVSVFRDAGAAARAFANIATPHGYLVDERGVIRGKRVVQSLTDLRALLRARELVEV